MGKYLEVEFLGHTVQCMFSNYIYALEIQIKYRSNNLAKLPMLGWASTETPEAAMLASWLLHPCCKGSVILFLSWGQAVRFLLFSLETHRKVRNNFCFLSFYTLRVPASGHSNGVAWRGALFTCTITSVSLPSECTGSGTLVFATQTLLQNKSPGCSFQQMLFQSFSYLDSLKTPLVLKYLLISSW